MTSVPGPLRAVVARPAFGGAVVALLALALRLALLHTARFGGDEALFFNIGMDIVEGKHLPLLGTQITDGAGRLPGPTFLYVMALPLLVWRAPEAQYAFVEILGAVTVGVFWHAMRRPFGERGALFAGVLMALSPWSALYADRTWNPNVLPLVVVLALLAALRVREDPRSPWLAAFLPLCAVMPHFHMSTPVAWAGLAVVVFPSVRRWRRRYVVIGLLLAALLYVPLAVHEIGTGLSNTRAIFSETVGNKQRFPTSFLWVPVYALRFLTLDVTYHELSGYWGGPNEIACVKAAFAGDVARPFSVLRLFAFLSSLGLAAAAVVVFVRKAPRHFLWAFLAALAANLALIGLTGKQVFGHYVTNLYPFVFVAYAALGCAVFAPGAGSRRRSVAARAAAVAVAAVFCAGGVEATLSVSRNVDGRIGLEVHRRALAAIDADARREGLENEYVRLDFGYFSSQYDWYTFATRAMNIKIHFDKRARRRVYRLQEHGKPPPPGARETVDVGYAVLYRR